MHFLVKHLFRIILVILILVTAPANMAAKTTPMLTMAMEAPPRAIDPRYAIDANSQYIENLTHCSLVGFDENGAVKAELAESWQWQDPKTLVLTIKTNAKFSDGKSVTTADVKATYDFFGKKNKVPPSPRAGAFAKLTGIETKNNNKLVFKLAEADSSFITNLVVGILPTALADGPPLDDPLKNIGCGPFKVVASTMQNLDLERNPHYSLGQPAKTNVSIKIVRDETTRFAKLRNGELDIVQNLINRDELSKIAARYPSLRIIRRPGLNTTYLGFNFKDPILGKKEVRQAIAHAINKQLIIDYVLKGYAKPAKTLITEQDAFYKKDNRDFNFDVKTAAALLDKAGYPDPDGKGPKPRFELTYKTTTDITRISIAKAIGSQLQQVGIKVNVQPLEWGRFKADVDGGNVQLWSLSWIGFKDPDIYRYAFATENFPPNGGNRGRYSNPQLDKLLTEARVTTDAKKRKNLYDQIQTIVGDELPYVFLWHEEIFAVVNRNVKDFKLYADGRWTALQTTYK